MLSTDNHAKYGLLVLCMLFASVVSYAQNAIDVGSHQATSSYAQNAIDVGSHQATYAAAVRSADGHVDTDALLARLQELGVDTYYWLIWRETDWEDLQVFLPKAAAAGINVWPYLVPPSESPPNTKNYSEPYQLDYQRWAEEIARLSLKHPNVTAWVIDDFYANKGLYTPEYVGAMQARAKSVNPKLAFLPLMYFGEIDRDFVEGYREVIDGVVVAYPQDAGEIYNAWAILNDVFEAIPGDLRFPASAPSNAGDYVIISQTAKVHPAESYVLRFRELDDYYGVTEGYHFKQFLVDGTVVWEADTAGGERTWRDVELDVTAQVKNKASVNLSFRLMDKQPVANYPVRWRVAELQSESLEIAAPLEAPEKWQVEKQGAFDAGFGDSLKPGENKFHIPFIVMTAAQEVEFDLRHGQPVTPERINDWLTLCFESKNAGHCDGVVTYCLDMGNESKTFDLLQDTFRHFRK